MSVYTESEFLATLDSIALQYERLANAFGTGIEEGSVSKACKTNFLRQTDLSNLPEEYTNAKSIITYAHTLYRKFQESYIPYYYRDLLSAIDDVQSIDDTLSNNDDRVHPNIKTMCDALNITLSPSNVMPPPIQEGNAMGKYEISGGSGTFTDGESIDTTQYGKAFLKVKTINAVGSSDLVLTITVKKIDNTEVDRQVTIPAGTEADQEFLIGDGSKDDMFIDVVNITHSSGNDGDAVKVISVWERELNE